MVRLKRIFRLGEDSRGVTLGQEHFAARRRSTTAGTASREIIGHLAGTARSPCSTTVIRLQSSPPNLKRMPSTTALRMSTLNRIPVCHVQLLPLLSGVQRVTLQIFDALDRRRFEPHVVMQGPGPFADELQRRDVRCHFVPNLVRPIHPLRDFAAYRDLKSLFRRERFQIVHTHCSKPGIVGRIAARHAGVPHVLHHVHTFPVHDRSSAAARLVYGGIERFAAAYADYLLFVSRHGLDTAAEAGVPREKCLIRYNGADLTGLGRAPTSRKDQRLRDSLGVRSEEALVLFVGRLDEQKQPWILPPIAAELERRLPNAAWTIAVAGDGAYREEIDRSARKLGVEHRLRMLGWQSEADVRRLYQAADIALLPSLWEGMPLSLIDAQGAGLPIVASDVSGNREVVTPETGCVCTTTDAADYADRLASLIVQPAVRRELGRRARRRAEALFDLDRNMRAITAVYDDLLAGRAPSLEAATDAHTVDVAARAA